ncbi:enterochelin esterase-like enzyme [Kineosphaera limosa]|uniref:Esterase n=1 Tax=Kineosphaera limosa NBRC 100340 TaxID=1184609 RepID=K6WT50_9MICO|nr:alpha/beta hydrolase-fold protein [Kineosphaera limosa]NYE00373.1 enterochelin esterase-like enzyme [Kineosphaera limosa]GAB97011.1 hypothetical protein KILIM_054_00210 [Kineosphaera limosa NBRC 100340]
MMSLSVTSEPFIWVLRALLAAAIVWAVWRWPRAAGPGIVAILRRLATIVVLTGLGVLNVLAPVNAEYGWYMTVADLMPGAGSGPGAAYEGGQSAKKATEAKLRSASYITGRRDRPDQQLSLTPTTVGGYQDFTVHGTASGVTGTVTVWFPPSYTTPAAAHREYPVIEAFHGIRPAPYAFFRVVGIDQAIAAEVAAHRMREAIVVVPHWAPGGQDNECVNAVRGVPGGSKMETWLTQDVPGWVYSTFRAAPGRTSWSALGLSAGGWCANMAATLHPSVFATAISFGGYWRPTFETYVPFPAHSPEAWRYDLVEYVKHHGPPVAVWTLTARQDKLAYPSTMEAQRNARAPMSVTATILPEGAHNADVWVPHVPEALAWLGSSSPGFAPT